MRSIEFAGSTSFDQETRIKQLRLNQIAFEPCFRTDKSLPLFPKSRAEVWYGRSQPFYASNWWKDVLEEIINGLDNSYSVDG